MKIPLEIAADLAADETTFAAAGRWVDMSGMRFVRGRPQVIGGWESLTLTLLTGVCRSILPWTDNAGSINIGFGTHSNLQVWVGGTIYDITPAGFVAGNADGASGPGYGVGGYGIGGYSDPTVGNNFAMTWSLSNYGQSLIANARGGEIYQWSNDTGTAAVELTNAPEVVTYAMATPQQMVLAIGCSLEADGTFEPMCVRHCSVEDLTDWTTTTTNSAREYILQGGGRLVAGRMMGEYALLWSDNALFLGTFIGDPTQVWRFDRVGEHCGLISPNAAVVVGHTAFWMSPDGQFYAYPLGGTPRPIPCDERAEMFENIALAQSDKITASSCGGFSEVRFDYPDGRDGLENSRYLLFNTLDGSWARGLMARTAYVDAGPTTSPIGTTAAGTVYWHERGQSADGDALPWFIESGDFFFTEAQNLTSVFGCWPDFQDQVGSVSLTINGRMSIQGDETVYGPYVLVVGTDKSDFLIEARLIRVRFEGSSAPAYLRLGKPLFDAKPSSEW